MALSAVPGRLPTASSLGGTVGDAASALVNLGYNPSQALGAVSRAAGRLGLDAPVEALIRGGLSELVPTDARATATRRGA
jgi:Holliday junction DNA helicase RuvA